MDDLSTEETLELMRAGSDTDMDALTLHRKLDGTFVLTNNFCFESQIHKPWCSPALSWRVLGILSVPTLACLIVGCGAKGWHYFEGVLGGVTAWLLMTTGSLGFIFLMIVACAFVKRPKTWQSCHLLSLAPVLAGLFVVAWSVYWIDVLPDSRYGCWQANIPGWSLILSCVLSAFLLYLYKGARWFFLAVFACQTWYGLILCALATMALNNCWL